RDRLHPPSFPTRRSSDLEHLLGGAGAVGEDPAVGGDQGQAEGRAAGDRAGPCLQVAGGLGGLDLTGGERREDRERLLELVGGARDRKSTRLNSSHDQISY